MKTTDRRALFALTRDLDALLPALEVMARVTPAHMQKVGNKLPKAGKQDKVLGTIHNQSIWRIFTACRMLNADSAKIHIDANDDLLPEDMATTLRNKAHLLKRLSELLSDLAYIQAAHDLSADWSTDAAFGIRANWVFVETPQNGPPAIIRKLLGMEGDE